MYFHGVTGFSRFSTAIFIIMLTVLLAPSSIAASQALNFVKQGDDFLTAGRNDEAIVSYSKALELAKGEEKISQALVLNRLGAAHTLNVKPASVSNDDSANVRGLRVVLKDVAENYLTDALMLARNENDLSLVASILNNMGNLSSQKGNDDAAMPYYRQSISMAIAAGNGSLAASASLNAARMALRVAGQRNDAIKHLNRGYEGFLAEGESMGKANGLLLAGRLFERFALLDPAQGALHTAKARNSYAAALRTADLLANDAIASYALGYEGHLLEDARRNEDALSLTRRALFRAQIAKAPELLYQWEWQLARILLATGDNAGAINAYRRALHNLQSVRQAFEGCSTCNVNFAENIEAVYLGYVDLLLKQASGGGNAPKLLQEIIDNVEQLRTAELQNYFKDACIEVKDSKRHSSTVYSGTTAIVYLITLPNKLEILASLPNGIKRITTNVKRDQLFREANLFRTALAQPNGAYLQYAQQIYDWVIRPLESELSGQNIKTIVLIPDGILRTIPFPALHDGTDFILKRYAFATTQGMQLTDTSASARRNDESILLAGLTESVGGFAPLPNVKGELVGIGSLFANDTFLNSNFVQPSIKTAVERKPYSMVHFATHGEFAGDSSNMFLLAWDGLLTINQLDKIIKVTRYKDEPLELLTLSACKTAVGDDQAALGMAGIAIRAGAKSTVATLWEIDDKATSELIVEFYRQLKGRTISKSMALREAQIKIMTTYQHPYYWSPFLLIGNWL